MRHSAFSPIEENLAPMGTSPEDVGRGKDALVHPIWDCGSPLYDSHELVSIVYTIERQMMLWPSYDGLKRPIITQFMDTEKETSIRHVSKCSSVVTSSSETFTTNMWLKKLTSQGIKKKHRKMKGRFFRLVCG